MANQKSDVHAVKDQKWPVDRIWSWLILNLMLNAHGKALSWRYR